jgi:NADP-dependent 3-hydroxy acid dehydrogenase YdfG
MRGLAARTAVITGGGSGIGAGRRPLPVDGGFLAR